MLHTDQSPPGNDMARSNTERSKALREKRRAAGWQLLHLWCSTQLHADLVRACLKLTRAEATEIKGAVARLVKARRAK
jgi:hypothetical protein